ncbi:MAG: T9SS type A sorting domain-containing protein [Saprospiraceae bacterium]|nr:T9SS type A sorting domain-containing protein [Saprospiraceae bacterium]
MKTTIFLSLFMVFTLGKANAQILEIGNKWIFDTKDYFISGPYSEKFDSIEVVADTLINGQVYFQLFASQVSPCGLFREVEYLREEDDKIYRLNEDGMSENLMIDFTNQPSYNMTFASGFTQSEIQTTVINDSTGTEILPSGDRIDLTYQRIINNSSYDDGAVYKLSKEIGYLGQGMLFPDIGTGLCDPYIFVNLRCQISGNDTIRLTDLDCYEPSKRSSTKDFGKEKLGVYPNPTYGPIMIKNGYELVSIHNLTGTKMSFSSSSKALNISSFPKGMYFLTVKSENAGRIYVNKIFKL